MKSYVNSAMEQSPEGSARLQVQMPASSLSALHLVSAHEIEELRLSLARGLVPTELGAKLSRLAAGSLLHRYVEQNCRLFIALLGAAHNGHFKSATRPERERLLRVLAYVRKDDDAIPDYKPGGFTDDQREVRAAATELALLLEAFKNWRLRVQVPELWAEARSNARLP